MNRVREMLPINWNQPRRDAQDGVLDGVYRMMVAGVVGVSSGDREARDQD